MTLTFEEAVFGTEKEVEVSRSEACSVCNGLRAEPGTEPKRCPVCNGSGEIRRAQRSIFGQFINVATCDRCGGEGRIVDKPCHHCKGSGREVRKRKLQVRIPAGVEAGSQIRISGEGEMGVYGGGRGNVYIALDVKEHELFRREGDHILLELEVSFGQAALGDEVQVPTLDGEKSLKIPAGTQSGHVFVLKKLGVPHVRGGGRGDMIIQVNVVTPKHLTEEQKRLLKELDQSLRSHDGKGLIDKVKETLGG